MSNRPFGSLNNTIVNSSDYISKKKQIATYKGAKQSTSGFGVAPVTESTDSSSVVVTARNYEDLLCLTKGMHHCSESSGAETLKYDIWSGNKMQMKYGTDAPIMYTGDLDAATGVTRPGEPNMIPYPSTINGTSGYPGFIVDPSGTLFGTGELGEGPSWVNTHVDVSYTNTADYKRGNKSQPLHNFSFPGRVYLKD